MRGRGSSWRGVRAWRRGRRYVNYAIRRLDQPGYWFHAWTPPWHEGRGPYLSIGLGRVAVYRGY